MVATQFLLYLKENAILNPSELLPVKTCSFVLFTPHRPPERFQSLQTSHATYVGNSFINDNDKDTNDGSRLPNNNHILFDIGMTSV